MSSQACCSSGTVEQQSMPRIINRTLNTKTNITISFYTLIVSILIHIPTPASSSSKIYLTRSLAEGVCNALEDFNAKGDIINPPKTQRGPMNCGYFHWDKCDLPCTPISDYVSCKPKEADPEESGSEESNPNLDIKDVVPQYVANHTVLFKNDTHEKFEDHVTDITMEETRKSENVRIVGGHTVAYRRKYPSIVQIHSLKLGRPTCGGTIIASQWVLTAAHCLQHSLKASDYFVRAGAYDRYNARPYEQDRAVKKIFRHEAYDENNIYNDIALFKVAKFDFSSDYVRSVKIAARTYRVTQPKLWAVGWGQLVEDGAPAGKLQEVDLPPIDSKRCMRILDRAIPKKNSILPDKVICAGYKKGGKDACKGDSGGPLFEEPGGYRVLVGVVSWGQGCARPGMPGVFAKVAAYNDWIHDKVKWN